MDFSAKERDLTQREKALSERERVSTDERERAGGIEREREMDLITYEILRSRNVISLRYLLEENELIFDKFLTDFVSQITPLQIAIQHRSVDFAREILRRKPQLAYVLSSQGFSPLRMASANGSVDIVRELLLLIVDVSDDRDSKGWTPVHAAAMKGHVDVLNVFNGTNPEWIRDITDRDETVLHLCVKYNDKLDALKMLIGSLGPENQLVNRKDENGNTILHLAAMKKDMEMIRYLISTESVVEINAANMNGFTALDVFTVYPSNSADNEMVKELQWKGAVRSGEMFTEKAELQWKGAVRSGEMSTEKAEPQREGAVRSGEMSTEKAELQWEGAVRSGEMSTEKVELQREGAVRSGEMSTEKAELLWKGAERSGEMSTEKAENELKNVLILVGILAATLCFQAALVPPGGLWQDDSNMGNNTLDQKNHTAGTSILADKDPNMFRQFQKFNQMVFLLSLIQILAGGTVGLGVVVNMLSFLPLQLYLPLVLCSLSLMIYSCNEVHTPKGLPHDIRSNLNKSNKTLLVLSLIICFSFLILNVVQYFRYLKRRLAVARNRGSNVDTENQQHS